MADVFIRTDDEVYRVDAVWLGPPRATFPWRARYVSYGVGLAAAVAVMAVQRRIGIGIDFFSVAWALLLAVVVTRAIGKRVSHDRPLGQIATLLIGEVRTPRAATTPEEGVLAPLHGVRVGPAVPVDAVSWWTRQRRRWSGRASEPRKGGPHDRG